MGRRFWACASQRVRSCGREEKRRETRREESEQHGEDELDSESAAFPPGDDEGSTRDIVLVSIKSLIRKPINIIEV